MPAHRGFPQVGGHSFVPFWHGGSISSAARQLPEADTVLLKKHLLSAAPPAGSSSPGG